MYSPDTHQPVENQKKFCPACFMAVRGEGVFFGQDAELHAFDGCLMTWSAIPRSEQLRRIAEAQRLADPESWNSRPETAGSYWARRRDSYVLSNVTLLQGVRGLVVKCGSTLYELAAMDGYLYTPRFTPQLREAA